MPFDKIIKEISDYSYTHSGVVNSDYLKINNYEILKLFLEDPDLMSALIDYIDYDDFTELIQQYSAEMSNISTISNIHKYIEYQFFNSLHFIEYTDFYENVHSFRRLVQRLQEIYNIRWHYFNFLNFNNPLIKAKFGLIPLNFENFEEGTTIFSLVNSIQVINDNEVLDISGIYGNKFYWEMSGRYGVNSYNYWNKKALVKAIIESGLQFGLFKKTTTTVVQETILTKYHKNNRNKLNLEEELFLANNKIPLQLLGLPHDHGASQYNLVDYVRGLGYHKSMNLYYYEEIYRRIHGTIYTINWDIFCQSGTIENKIYQLLTNEYLEIIRKIYYNQSITNLSRIEYCQYLADNQGQAIILMQSYQNNIQGWVDFLLSQYQRYLNNTKSNKRPGDSLRRPTQGNFK